MPVIARTSLAAALLALLVLTSCVETSRTRELRGLTGQRLIASAFIEADTGGRVQAAEGDLHANVSLTVPANAIDRSAQFDIYVNYGDARLPSVIQTFEVRSAAEIQRRLDFRIEYSETYVAATGGLFDEDEIDAFAFEDDGSLRHYAPLSVDREANVLFLSIDQTGTVFAAHPTIAQLALGSGQLYDPTVPVRVALDGERLFLASNGATAIPLGSGSLDSFRRSSADDNVVIIHSSTSNVAEVGTSVRPSDPGGWLVQNVVLFGYPGGRSVREAGNRLYAELMTGAEPTFGTNVIAHGTGGLVARYAIEQAHLDTERPGYTADDRPLSDVVERLVLISTPNQGAEGLGNTFAPLIDNALPNDLPFVQGLVDVLPGPDGFTARLNELWLDSPPTRYLVMAGDADGRRTDGVVSVLSALSVPNARQRPADWIVFNGRQYTHEALVANAAGNGVGVQLRNWLSESPLNSPPMVTAVETPIAVQSGLVSVEFRVADADRDLCDVDAWYSLDGQNWLPASRGPGSSLPPFTSDQAPGRPHVFVWNPASAGIGLGRRARVWLRFVPRDPIITGFRGETGSFVVQR